jgi:hypothetical protein
MQKRPNELEYRLNELDAGQTAMTIAMVGAADTHWGTADVVACLAELAATDELVVVVESDPHSIVAGLRDVLPRHTVVSLYVAPRPGHIGRDAEQVDTLLDLGSLPIVVTQMGAATAIAADLYDLLAADRMLRVSYSLSSDVDPMGRWLHRAAVSNLQPPRGEFVRTRCAA